MADKLLLAGSATDHLILADGSGDLLLSPGCYYDEVIADAPLVYLRLGESAGSTAVDEMATYNGTYITVSAPPTLGVAGATADGDTAADFDGSGSRVDILGMTGDLGQNYTLECYLAWTNTGFYQVVIGKGANGPGLVIDPSGNVLTSKLFVADIAQSTVGLTAGVLTHIAVTKAGTASKIYISGEDRTGTVTDQTISNTSPIGFVVASDTPVGAGSLNTDGTIDEVAIYDYAVSAERIAVHAAAAARDCSSGTLELTGSTTLAGSFVKAIQKFLAGSAGTPTGVARKTSAKFVAGSAGMPSGVARKTGLKYPAGSAGTPAGALRRAEAKFVAGSAGTPAGTLTKSVDPAAALAGSAGTPAGGIDHAGGKVVTIHLEGS